MTSVSILTQDFMALDSFGSTLNFFNFFYFLIIRYTFKIITKHRKLLSELLKRTIEAKHLLH